MFDHTEWQRKRRRENPERDREHSRRYYWRHKDDPEWQEQRKMTARRHYDLHKQERNAKAREWSQCLKAAAIEHYGKACACCGESIYEFLCIDHINGGGNKHRKMLGCSRNFFSWLRRNGYPEGFRTLCHNCNQSLGYNGYCPHQQKRPAGRVSPIMPLLIDVLWRNWKEKKAEGWYTSAVVVFVRSPKNRIVDNALNMQLSEDELGWRRDKPIPYEEDKPIPLG